jgi:hypothetical protein
LLRDVVPTVFTNPAGPSAPDGGDVVVVVVGGAVVVVGGVVVVVVVGGFVVVVGGGNVVVVVVVLLVLVEPIGNVTWTVAPVDDTEVVVICTFDAVVSMLSLNVCPTASGASQ